LGKRSGSSDYEFATQSINDDDYTPNAKGIKREGSKESRFKVGTYDIAESSKKNGYLLKTESKDPYNMSEGFQDDGVSY
jgi:hypothetical protein